MSGSELYWEVGRKYPGWFGEGRHGGPELGTPSSPHWPLLGHFIWAQEGELPHTEFKSILSPLLASGRERAHAQKELATRMWSTAGFIKAKIAIYQSHRNVIELSIDIFLKTNNLSWATSGAGCPVLQEAFSELTVQRKFEFSQRPSGMEELR